MEPTTVCDLVFIRKTPIFAVCAIGRKWQRVFGATYVRKEGIWFFPAFYPYCSDVVRDLGIVEPDIAFTEAAQTHIQRCTELETLGLNIPTRTNGYSPVLDMFQHQREGLEFVLRMLRCALFFDMGLGKTKIVFDAIRVGKWRTLVLAPSVGLGTWVHEAEKHAPELRVVCLGGESDIGKKAARVRRKEIKDLKAAIASESDAATRTALERNLDVMVGPTRAAKIAEVADAATADVIVTTYDTAKLYQPYIFDQVDYEMIVADESQNLRDPKTSKTKAALALASKAFRRVILTGTPSLGNPLHLYGQLAFLGKYIPAKNQWIFRKHHVIFAKGSDRIQVGYKNLDMLNDKVHRVALVRKKDTCLDLPKRTVTDTPFQVSPEQRKLYNGLVDRAVVELSDGTLYDPDHAATALQKMLQVLSGFIIEPPPPVCDHCRHVQDCVKWGIKPFTPKCPIHPKPWPRKIQRMKTNPKLEALVELLDGIPNEKVIIWAYFREELNIVEELLTERGIGYIRIDGTNSSTASAASVRFNKDPNIKVWLAQVSTGVALTLTSAAYTIYFGLTYRLDDYLQSMDRNYRIGQERPTFVYRLFCPRSALEFVARALSAKLDLANTLTTRIDCVVCERGMRCIAESVIPFGKGCKYKSRMDRVITRPGKL